MSNDRRTQLIVVGAVLILAAAGWWYFSSPSAPSTTSGTPARRTAQDAPPLPPAEAVAVQIDTLDRAARDAPDSQRNLFRFGAATRVTGETPTPPPFTPVAPPAPDIGAKPADMTASATPIPLKFLGTLEKSSDGVKLAVLSLNDGRAPMYGKEGDIIDGRYRIVKIGAESIEMTHLDGRGRQSIRLSGQ
jgi:hypothetical protein